MVVINYLTCERIAYADGWRRFTDQVSGEHITFTPAHIQQLISTLGHWDGQVVHNGKSLSAIAMDWDVLCRQWRFIAAHPDRELRFPEWWYAQSVVREIIHGPIPV